MQGRAPCQLCPLCAYLGDPNRLAWVWLRGEHEVCQAEQERRRPCHIFLQGQGLFTARDQLPLNPVEGKTPDAACLVSLHRSRAETIRETISKHRCLKNFMVHIHAFPPWTAKHQGLSVQNPFKDLTQLLCSAPRGEEEGQGPAKMRMTLKIIELPNEGDHHCSGRLVCTFSSYSPDLLLVGWLH